jgi:hypothetical protein
VNTLDDITREVCRLVFLALDQKHVEVEAKFGTIIDKAQRSRLALPIMSDAMLERGQDFKFDTQVAAVRDACFHVDHHDEERPLTPHDFLPAFTEPLQQVEQENEQANHPGATNGQADGSDHANDYVEPPESDGLSV